MKLKDLKDPTRILAEAFPRCNVTKISNFYAIEPKCNLQPPENPTDEFDEAEEEQPSLCVEIDEDGNEEWMVGYEICQCCTIRPPKTHDMYQLLYDLEALVYDSNALFIIYNARIIEDNLVELSVKNIEWLANIS